MPKIKFTDDYTVDAPGGATYKAGDIEDMSGPSARHFVNRSVAIYWSGKKPKPKPEPQASGQDRRIKPDYETQPETVGEPKHIGGGMYLLPDGTKIKGKGAADEAMSKMKIGNIAPEPDRAAIAKRNFSDG